MQTDLTKFKIEIKKEYDDLHEELLRLSSLLEKVETIREELKAKEMMLDRIHSYEAEHNEKQVPNSKKEFDTSSVSGYVRSLFLANPTQEWFLKELINSVQREIDSGSITTTKKATRGLLDTVTRRLVKEGIVQKFTVGKTPYFQKAT